MIASEDKRGAPGPGVTVAKIAVRRSSGESTVKDIGTAPNQALAWSSLNPMFPLAVVIGNGPSSMRAI